MSADLFGRPTEDPTVQGELALPGEDVIDRQPILLASDLPLDPLTRDMFERMDKLTEDWTETLACPHCGTDLAPVAMCAGVWGCPECRETWHVEKKQKNHRENVEPFAPMDDIRDGARRNGWAVIEAPTTTPRKGRS